MTKRLLITGAGGYIGSRMTELLLQAGYAVCALDRYFFGDTLADLVGQPGLQIVKEDIRGFDKTLLQDVDAVIDLAGISNDPSSELLPSVTRDINYKGSVRVAGLAKEMGVRQYIFSSSCSVYGAGKGIIDESSGLAPISTYAKCKIAAEKDLLELADDRFNVTLLRNATVYGLSTRRMRFDLLINIMTLHAWRNRKIHILGGGKQWRPLVHVDDVTRAFRLVLEHEHIALLNREVFNVGTTEQNYQVFQVANRYRDFFPNLDIETTPDDPDARDYHVNFDKIRDVLGFAPEKTINDGIAEIKDALERGLIEDTLKTHTVDYYRYLVQADEVLKTVKLHGKIF